MCSFLSKKSLITQCTLLISTACFSDLSCTTLESSLNTEKPLSQKFVGVVDHVLQIYDAAFSRYIYAACDCGEMPSRL